MTETADPRASLATTEPVTLPAPAAARDDLGYLFASVGALLFATKSIAIKLAYTEPVDATIMLALRMAMSLPIYGVIAWLALRDRRARGIPLPSRELTGRAALVGAIGYWLASYGDFYGLQFISAQFERLILFTYPLFVVVFGAMFFGQPLRWRALAAIGVSYLGLVVIFLHQAAGGGGAIAIGAGLVLIAAIAFALYQLMAKPLIAAIGPRLFTCIAMAGAAASSFVQFALTHPAADLAQGPRILGLSVYLALGATVLPSFFMSAALHRISAAANAAIGTLSPVVTILLAVAILGEPLTWIDAAGTALVIAGVGWFTLADRRA